MHILLLDFLFLFAITSCRVFLKVFEGLIRVIFLFRVYFCCRKKKKIRNIFFGRLDCCHTSCMNPFFLITLAIPVSMYLTHSRSRCCLPATFPLLPKHCRSVFPSLLIIYATLPTLQSLHAAATLAPPYIFPICSLRYYPNCVQALISSTETRNSRTCIFSHRMSSAPLLPASSLSSRCKPNQLCTPLSFLT